MKILHTPHHWLAVTIVLAVAMLTMSLAHGQQRNDAGVTFQGRPAMAGAQSGTGALAGPAQGGIGIQGSDNAGVALRPPSGLRDMPQGTVTASGDAIAVNKAVRDDKDIVKRDRDSDVIKRDRDSGVAKDERSTVKKTKRAAKNVVKQARHGVPTVDSTRTPG
ncbi:hypothetical protein [Ramlibacter sp. PS4R-6]|uniref:hypothetical protein n=1 Tax=Ramlibacter sp. PS4R-6 TaxID=3133438 RepID=UPI0030AE7BC4